MKEKDIRLSTIKRIENKFNNFKAWSCRGLSVELNLNYYAVKVGLNYLLEQNKIRSLESSNRGELYIKNE